MAKLKIFLGFASKNRDMAMHVAMAIEKKEDLCTRWDTVGVIGPGDYTYNRLIDIAKQHDGAIFIFAGDDPVLVNGAMQEQPRDNVLIEFGLFSGVLGLDAVCFCRVGDSKTAKDLDGITYIPLGAEGVNATAESRIVKWLAKVETNVGAIPAVSKMRELDSSFPLLQLFTPSKRDESGTIDAEPKVFALTDTCKQFFNYAPNASDEKFYGKPAKKFRDKLKDYISPPDHFWEDLSADQDVVYRKLGEGQLPLAQVPVTFNNKHDYYKGKSFVPIIVQRENIKGGEVLTILYLESGQLPKTLLVDRVWIEVAKGINVSDLGNELWRMADGWEVSGGRIDALKNASKEALNGGNMRAILSYMVAPVCQALYSSW